MARNGLSVEKAGVVATKHRALGKDLSLQILECGKVPPSTRMPARESW